jgi:putative transposase
LAYHVLNRAVGRGWLFDDEPDYLALERVIERTHERLPMRIVCYCLMSNHWHFVLWPEKDGDLSEFMRLLTVTHTQRWHAHHHTAGMGPLYQGRFKSFPIQRDEHFLTACRYVERNALRAKLAETAQVWEWSSVAKRAGRRRPAWLLPMSQWPVQPPRDWTAWVNRPETEGEFKALGECVKRGRPYGEQRWVERTAERLKLESTLARRGRPRVRPIKDSRPFSSAQQQQRHLRIRVWWLRRWRRPTLPAQGADD